MGAPLRGVFELPFRDEELEPVGFLVAKLEADFVLCVLECRTDGLPREEVRVEGVGEADCCSVKDRFSLLGADHMGNPALLEDFANEL